MWHRMVCTLIVGLISIGFVACGDVDDEGIDQPTRITSQPESQTTTSTDIDIASRPEIDFGDEETAIREVFDTHNAALRAGHKELDEAMDHWLQTEKREVFMVQDVAGAINIIEGWSGVKNSWASTWSRLGSVPIPVTIAEVGIDKKGQNATVAGDYKWGGGSAQKYIAALKKDDGVWKVRAIDFGLRSGFIKAIETPE